MRRCRFSDLNFFPSSSHTMGSGWIGLLINTTGVCASTGVSTEPVAVATSALCACAIKDGSSVTVTVLLRT